MLAGLSRLRPIVPLVLRLILGAVFVAHGAQKLAGGTDGFASTIARLGLPLPWLCAWAAAFCELLGGACVLLGFFSREAALAIAIVTGVAVTRAHGHQGFVGGYEYPLVLLGVAVSVMLMGAGPVSVDRTVLHRDR